MSKKKLDLQSNSVIGYDGISRFKSSNVTHILDYEYLLYVVLFTYIQNGSHQNIQEIAV